MSLLSSCFPSRRRDADREPLLPQHQTGASDATALQQSLHHKMRVYQMIRAVGYGNMPSNEQLIANLRAFMAADALNPDMDPHSGLSFSGRKLVREVREVIKAVITLLRNKNDGDEIQDLIWNLTKARVSIDVQDMAARAGKAKKKADVVAAYRCVQTISSLLTSNTEFRALLSDLGLLARGVFKDTAQSLSGAAGEVGQQLEGDAGASEINGTSLTLHPEVTPDGKNGSSASRKAIKSDDAAGDKRRNVPSDHTQPNDLGEQVAEVKDMIKAGTAKVAEDVKASAESKLSDERNKQRLKARLKAAVQSLSRKPDYDSTMQTLGLLAKRFVLTYSRALDDLGSAVDDNLHENEATDEVVKSIWRLVMRFGDPKAWNELQNRFDKVMAHRDSDPKFEQMTSETVDSLEKLLTDPDFVDDAEKRYEELREKARGVDTESSLRKDVDALLEQAHKTIDLVWKDKDVAEIVDRMAKISQLVSPEGEYVNGSLVSDTISVLVPAAVFAIQTVPIPRLEVSTPTADILLENLFVTPGHTVNNSSFLPYHLRISTVNALDVHKHRATSQVSSNISTNFTITLSGLSIRAEDVGYVMSTHYPFLPFTSSGLASVALDERGTDIEISLDVKRHSLDNILKLRAVKVHVHKLTYKLTHSPFSLIAWILKPLLRPILRKILERELARAIATGINALNRETLFARERVRAVKVTQPGSVWALLKALKARWTPEADPDLDVRVGIDAPTDQGSKFKGVYAPGSVVGLWWDEQRRREEIEVLDEERRWRSGVFDVQS